MYIFSIFMLAPSNNRIEPLTTCKIQLVTATENDHPYQFCCHLGIQSLSFPLTAKVITAMAMKRPDVSVSSAVLRI
ncbi:hypothetical protein BpHYR1_019922 [Brachionus plicatilis]|uniref:Uncharacterized protein n=1 Tax=Brachionus plicatilis TaxID=10195 RepID=A0A3M7SXN4_BRAPC|nr:hypothetical protein BpHYR1_019922 [Brachionus plicatilis]